MAREMEKARKATSSPKVREQETYILFCMMLASEIDILAYACHACYCSSVGLHICS